MKFFFFFILVLISLSCSRGVNKTHGKSYPKLEDVIKNENVIFDYHYCFADAICIKKISLNYKDINTYQLIVSFENTDFDKLENKIFAAVFYPLNPELIIEPIFKGKESRMIPFNVDIKALNNDFVIAQDFKINPKEFSKVKFYFYERKGEVVNDKIMTVRNVKLQSK